MGQVAVTFKVMPESPDVDIARLKTEIREKMGVQEIREEPIGFGLVALKVLVVLPDASGGTDKLEKMLSDLEGVASVETEDVTLL